MENIHRWLRTNFEIRGGGAFWEDRLFTDSEHVVEFTVGIQRSEVNVGDGPSREHTVGA